MRARRRQRRWRKKSKLDLALNEGQIEYAGKEKKANMETNIISGKKGIIVENP